MHSLKFKSLFIRAMQILIAFWLSSFIDASDHPGHLKPLGSYGQRQGVTAIGKFSSPLTFYSEFVSQSKPIWMLNALETVHHPGLANWTDGFMKKNYGHVSVKVETSKKEDRLAESKSLTLRQYLTLYRTENVYMVQSMRSEMSDLVLVPPSLTCGGFQHNIQDAVMWLGSGKTKSVLHYDVLDNLLCLLDGKKDIVLIDQVHKEAVEADGFISAGSYSLVDVDEVDMDEFPKFIAIPLRHVRLSKGDCVFIPKGWYHQVTSSGKRHLAINYWFSHLHWFNTSDCTAGGKLSSGQSSPKISTIGYASPNEVLRSQLLEKLSQMEPVTKYNFVSSLQSSTAERREKFFDAVDKYKDSLLSWSEMYGFHIDKAVQHFPDIFDIPGLTPMVPDDFVLFDPISHPYMSNLEDDDSDEDTDDDNDDNNNDNDNDDQNDVDGSFKIDKDINDRERSEWQDTSESQDEQHDSSQNNVSHEKDEL